MEMIHELSSDGCAERNVYRQMHEGCNRDCANCALVQDSAELLEMYDFVVEKVAKEIQIDEWRERLNEWQDWQREWDPRGNLVF